MSKNLTIKNDHYEKQLFFSRLSAMVLWVIAIILIVIARLVDLQWHEHHFYSTLSQKNLMNIIPIPPSRGLIYDRNGVLVAQNVPVYGVDIVPAYVDHLDKTLEELRHYFPLSQHDIDAFKKDLKNYHRFDAVPLKLKLTSEEVNAFAVDSYRFKGVQIETRLMRDYPFGETLAPILGYVSRINAQELSQLDPVNYRATNYIGKTGIERFDEHLLHGQVGAEVAETDVTGRVVRVLKRINPKSGDNLFLTIDSKLQAFAMKALGDNVGAIVAMEPTTGQILAFVSQPTYDPNLFINGISNNGYQQLLNAPDHPLYNRALDGLYAPGSTIKPFYALLALSAHLISPSYRIYDPGWFQLPNTQHVYHDWIKHGGHGWVNLSKAIAVSCDIFFYNLAVLMGINDMDKGLSSFGFGQSTHIDLPHEQLGIVPSPQWKRENEGKPWYPGDTVITGIGQGALLVTPLQLAVATSIIANRGLHVVPQTILYKVTPGHHIEAPNVKTLAPVVLSGPDNWETVIAAMQQVVDSPYGTAAAGFGRHPNYTVAAKTGTAQVYGEKRDEEQSQTDIPKPLRSNHLFICFAPVEHPKIVVVVVVEHNGFADHIARLVLDEYFRESFSLNKGQ